MFYTKSDVSGSPKCQTRLILQASGAGGWGEGCGYSIRTAWPPAPHSLMEKVLISKALGVGSLPRYEGGSSRGNKYLVEGQYFRTSAPQLSAVHASRLLGFRQFSLTPHADTDPSREKVLFSSKWIKHHVRFHPTSLTLCGRVRKTREGPSMGPTKSVGDEVV